MVRVMDREVVKVIIDKIKGLNEELSEYGVRLTVGNAEFDSTEMEVLVKGMVASSKKEADQALFARDCGKVGLAPSDFNRPIVVDGNEFILVGVLPRGRIYKYVGLAANGKKYKLDVFEFLD